MDAIKISDEQGRFEWWMCYKCQQFVSPHRGAAESCCQPQYCARCNAPTVVHWRWCSKCRSIQLSRKAEERWQRAPDRRPIFNWDGPVALDDPPAGVDEYYPSVDALVDALEDEDIEKPWPLVHGTEVVPMRFDACMLVEHACEELYDDAVEDISSDAVHALQEALNTWLKEHGLISYHIDYKVALEWPKEPS